MKQQDLDAIGIPSGAIRAAVAEYVRKAVAGGEVESDLFARLARVVAAPQLFRKDAQLGALALAVETETDVGFKERDTPAPFEQWGVDLDENSIEQLRNACRLPISVRGAIMPDAHRGYGLPIGGVLATRGAVIPYAVGVDIACRMKLTVLDIPVSALDEEEERLATAIRRETQFGIGAKFKRRRQHQVLDQDWSVTKLTQNLKDKAWAQLGTSGSGNHFVEFGVLEAETDADGSLTAGSEQLGLEAGNTYLALLSHSGSRGSGATVASHYSKLARQRHPELPKELVHLAWLDLDSEEGDEYWQAMNLMGDYAAANHACIHHHIAEHLGAEVMLDVENHHNFAWKEVHDGEEVIVHRKGATPAGDGVLGVIPGSMADNAYIVRGKDGPGSLSSASHGAGRVMSRTQAKKTLSWEAANQLLRDKRVKLMSAGLDEVPMVYKNIETVMSEQRDLVEPLARFAPRLVKMAPAGERPED